MWPAELVQCIECGGDGYLDISPLLCLHVSTAFLSILSFGPSGLLNASQGTLALWTPLFSGSHLCIGSEIMREWALSPPRARATEFYSVLRSYPSHTRYVNLIYNSLHDAIYLC